MVSSCGVKPEQLPFLSHSYISKIEFVKNVENIKGKLKKERFKHGIITSPFYFILKIKEVENKGELFIKFYNINGKKKDEKSFEFGDFGKYYEYVICFDRIDKLTSGRYHYIIFFNNRLIYEDYLNLNEKKG